MGPTESSIQARILVVDDEQPLRRLIIQLLSDRGFETIEAEDGEQGIRLARTEMPDLVLCDLEMPRMDGYQVLAALQAERRFAATPVIILTALGEPSQVRHGMNLGADDYLTKPFDSEDLVNAIKARLARVRRLRAPTAPEQRELFKLGNEDTVLIKSTGQQRLVKVAQLTHITAYGEYSWLYWEKSKGAMLRKALKHWAGELPERFIRVHRSAIVNLAYLDRVEQLLGGRMQVFLRDTAQPIPVSVRLAASLNRKLRDLGYPSPAAPAPGTHPLTSSPGTGV
jgi:CheY-like chemotaxis protein